MDKSGGSKCDVEGQDIQERIPSELSVQDYVEARAQEMVAMSRASKTIIGNHQPQQKLPRHMRRRAASHNVKRLPRKMHNWASREYVKAGPPTKNKRPSRKHRRRPKNLLEEYNRRKRRFVWLETHIWHAKRFHMAEKWGYKIPLHPNDKGARAAYRASAKYCLLQDYSYYCCVEISGPEHDIVEALSHLCSTDTGLTFGAKAYIDGTREGELVAYYFDQYPYGAMGPVKFMWRYRTEGDADRAIWLWVHPAMYAELMKELRIAFDKSEPLLLDEEHEMDSELAAGEHEEYRNQLTEMKNYLKQHQNQSKAKHRRLMLKWKLEKRDRKKQKHSDKSHKYIEEVKDPKVLKTENFCSGDVSVTSLKDSICRFHLTGPLSNEVLRETLKVSDISNTTNNTDAKHPGDTEMSDGINGPQPWWHGCYAEEAHRNTHLSQEKFWTAVRETESPSELPPHCVLGLTVCDPRKSLPHKKSMVQYENKGSQTAINMREIPKNVSWSPLWWKDVRDNVKKSKLSDFQINEQRSLLLVPGTELGLSVDESRIPVILIQNPGHQVSPASTSNTSSASRPGYSCGWDVILPSGWSKPFLVSLVYRGARVAGLKETHSLAVEAGVYSFPNNFPDTESGRRWELLDFMEMEAKHYRVPPAKRPNFEKLGVGAPFHYPWQQLINEWTRYVDHENNHAASSSVVHGKCEMSNTNGRAADTGTSSNQVLMSEADLGEFCVLRDKSALRKLQNLLARAPQKVLPSIGDSPPAKVSRSSVDMSSVHKLDSVCDISEFLSDTQCLVPVRITLIRRGHSEPLSMICLPTAEDLRLFSTDKSYGGPLEPVHKEDRTKEERAENRKAKDKKTKISSTEPPPIREPPKIKTVIQSCSRAIMGYIKDGNFSYARGCGFGIGFVTCQSLQYLTKLDRPRSSRGPVVLVRLPTSLQYRYANLTIA